ncbi:acetyltransferase (GNAT) family protein [Pseudonocardia hierapolitana]|uniref:Acetyltransferase (GNAT) family protein n=2 Tax=Pseudonocardia hierapolitana TaxID=1128676 RepID=A0A561SV56_9PSEU|nr:acetyltransferase (GNAT) family protein [Pseudonocardia hierapolitana]
MRRAGTGEIADVLAVLDEVAGWLDARGVRQWPPRFERVRVEPAVLAGETWLAVDDEHVLATVTLDRADRLWADHPASATYVHRLAVRRVAAGLGGRILGWAARRAAAEGCHYLRLDCVASNRRLRDYYEAAGFRHRGDVEVTGPPGGRGEPGSAVGVSRYELALPG